MRERLGQLLDRPVLVVGVAFALRAALAGVLFATQLIPHNRWYFPNDDQLKYYDFARGVADGRLHPTVATIGYDLVLVPFAAATGFVLQALPAVAIVQGLLAIPAAWLLLRAGTRLAGRRAATLATALWVVSPLVGLLYLPPAHGPADVWLGLKILTDYPGALLAILVVAVASGARDDHRLARPLAAGVAAGFATLVKPTNLILAAGVVAALVAWRNLRGAAVAAAATAIVFVPQLVVDQRLFGGLFELGYRPSVARKYPGLTRSLEEGSWSPLNVPRVYGRLVLNNVTGPILPLAAAAALVLAWRRAPSMRWLVVAPAAAYAVGLGMYHYSIGDHFVRIATPLVPLLCLAVGAAVVPEARRRERVRPLPRVVPALSIALLAGFAGLAAWLAVAPRDPPRELQSLRPTAAVAGGRVTLRWQAPPAPAHLTYTLMRSPSLAAPADSVIRGFHWSFERPAAVAAVREGTRYVDRPPPGTWFYRVRVTPSADRDGWPPGMPVATSPPVRVDVRRVSRRS